MSTTKVQIAALEEHLRIAEFGPGAKFFEDHLDDNAVLVSETGDPFAAKLRVVEAHQPGKSPKFTQVEMTGLNIVDHGQAAVVSCRGTYEGPSVKPTLLVRKSRGRRLSPAGRAELDW